MSLVVRISAIVSLVCCGVWAQDPHQVLAQAQRLYAAGRYDSTAAVLQAFIKNDGKNPANEYLVPLLVDALVRTQKDDFAERLLVMYRKKFPEAAFVPRLTYLEGILLSRGERYQDAVKAFSRALDGGLTDDLDSLSLQNVEHLCLKVFSRQELTQLARSPGLNPRVKEIVEYYELVASYQSGQVVKARQDADEFRKEYPRSAFGGEVDAIASKSRDSRQEGIPIGLLAPLSGYDADIGSRIVQGIQLAIDGYNRGARSPVKLIMCDTRGSTVETARQALALLNQHKVSLILGPVLSQEAVVAAAALVGKDAVMISPTATEDGIAELGPNIFQMNVTLGSLGAKVAEYAIKNLNIREFAVVSPLSDYGQMLSRRFKEHVVKLGGRIVDEEYYDEGTTDFQPQFQKLRAALIKARREKNADESSIPYNPSRRQTVSDSVYFADSTLEVGGLFMPAEAEDVVMLAPQVFFHKIRTQMLGCTGWHTAKTIADGKRYVNNAIISTNLDTGGTNQRWSEFSVRYKARYQRDPDRVAALGFDAAELMLAAVKEAGGQAGGVARRLSQVTGYAGVSGRISFDPATGANTEGAIVKISDKQFIRIQ